MIDRLCLVIGKELELSGEVAHLAAASAVSQSRRRNSSTIAGIIDPDMTRHPAKRIGSGKEPSSKIRRTRQVSVPKTSASSRVVK